MTRSTALRRIWPKAAIVLGAVLLAYGLSGFDGHSGGHGALAYFGFTEDDRLMIAWGAGLLALGWVADRRVALPPA